MSAGRSGLSFSVGRNLPYLSALDGLRAIAVVAVILYHADEAWLQGGYLGVEVFFTISGYLITALLVTEYERDGRVDLIRFWRRRARRLLPALGVLMIGVTLLAMVTARDALGSLTGQGIAALAYVMNWSLIFTEQSYFESFGRPPLLQHLWSLAIEEQFYLVFPLLFLAGRRLLGRRLTLWLFLAGVVASTALMWTSYTPGTDPSRLYYGTDTRAAGILVGVALAMMWRPWSGLGAGRVQSAALPDLLGVVGMGVLLSQFVLLGAYQPRLYQGGFLLVALATAAVIGAVVTPGSFLSVPLSWRGLRWIGTRSYSLYLWHWPLFMVMRPGVDTVVGDPWLTIVRLGATAVIAEISFTYIEQPIREGRFTEQLRSLRRGVPEQASLKRGAIVTVLSLVAMAAVGNVQLPVDSGVVADGTMVQAAGPAAGEVIEIRPGREGQAPPRTGTATDGAEIPPPRGEGAAAEGAQAAALGVDYERVFVFGDSVIVGATEAFQALGPQVQVDARIGRQWHELVDDDRRPGPDDAVVIHLGSNGASNTETIDAVLDHFTDAGRVVLVNVRVPRPWETTVNRSLSGATGRWPNTRLADWKGASDRTPAYFAGDGVHVSSRGAEALAGVVVTALRAP
ncbi:acyltransferase family protein [soil metagenome]